MIVEVEGKQIAIGWREAAAMLTMYMVDWHAATLSDLELVAGNYVNAVKVAGKLIELGLVKSYSVRKVKIYALTELGLAAASELKRKAQETGIWEKAEEVIRKVE
ncbi:MAG: hypothetical protein QXY49_07035 [Thermofilaceae archaeon]